MPTVAKIPKIITTTIISTKVNPVLACKGWVDPSRDFLFKIKAFHSLLRKVILTMLESDTYLVSDFCAGGEILQDIIDDFSPDKFVRFFREKNRLFAPRQESVTHYDDESLGNGAKLGDIKFSESEKLIVCAFQVKQSLSERSGKKAQYENGKKILKDTLSDAGIFIFYDQGGNFRFSLIYPETIGNKRQWSSFRRFTYFVNREFTNKTFVPVR